MSEAVGEQPAGGNGAAACKRCDAVLLHSNHSDHRPQNCKMSHPVAPNTTLPFPFFKSESNRLLATLY